MQMQMPQKTSPARKASVFNQISPMTITVRVLILRKTSLMSTIGPQNGRGHPSLGGAARRGTQARAPTIGPPNGLENFPTGMVPVGNAMEQIELMGDQNATLRHEVDALRDGLRNSRKEQLRFVALNGISRLHDREYWPDHHTDLPHFRARMTRFLFQHRDNAGVHTGTFDLHIDRIWQTDEIVVYLSLLVYINGHYDPNNPNALRHLGYENGRYIYVLPAGVYEDIPMMLRSRELRDLTMNLVDDLIRMLETTYGLDFVNISNVENGHPFDDHHIAPMLIGN
jgi:hypothetical protein